LGLTHRWQAAPPVFEGSASRLIASSARRRSSAEIEPDQGAGAADQSRGGGVCRIDALRPATALRLERKFACRIKLICPVQIAREKYFA
jgi:hypothetical protein